MRSVPGVLIVFVGPEGGGISQVGTYLVPVFSCNDLLREAECDTAAIDKRKLGFSHQFTA